MSSKNVTKELDQFFSSFPERFYSKGQILLHAGDQPDKIFFLKKGKIRQYDITYNGNEVVVNVFKPYSFFPINYALTDVKNNYIFEAETDVTVNVAPTEDVVKFLNGNPDVVFDLLVRVYKGMDGILGRMVQLMSGSAKSRLVYEIIIECHRFGEIKNDGSYFIPINETELATRAGLSRETVSREIHKSDLKGLIVSGNKGLHIKSIVELEKKLRGEL